MLAAMNFALKMYQKYHLASDESRRESQIAISDDIRATARIRPFQDTFNSVFHDFSKLGLSDLAAFCVGRIGRNDSEHRHDWLPPSDFATHHTISAHLGI